jgi:hypothetical protein
VQTVVKNDGVVSTEQLEHGVNAVGVVKLHVDDT